MLKAYQIVQADGEYRRELDALGWLEECETEPGFVLMSREQVKICGKREEV